VVVADVTENSEAGLIKIGAGLGARKPTYVGVHEQKGRVPPYLYSLNSLEILRYSTPRDFFGCLLQVARSHRRKVYNAFPRK
jgi:hypothetical protein